MVPPSRPMRTDDEMSVQEPKTTHVSVAHPSASETVPSDVPWLLAVGGWLLVVGCWWWLGGWLVVCVRWREEGSGKGGGERRVVCECV